MKVVACFKYVPDMDSLKVKADRTLDMSSAAWEIGQYDLRAVEEAVKLAAASDGTAVALTVGGEALTNSKMKKAILARGPAELIGIQDDAFVGADSCRTAKALKAAVEKIGDAELVICGEGSSDQYNQQVGNILGGMLGWTTVNSVSKIDWADGKLVLERSVEDGVEVIEVSLPAVISVTSDINVPRIPSMKDIMAAGKKPAAVSAADEIGGLAGEASVVRGVLAPEQKERMQQVIEKADEDGIAAFVAQIRKAL